MRTSAHLRRRARRGTWLVPAFVAAVVVHAVALLVVIPPLTQGVEGPVAVAAKEAPEEAPVEALAPSCVGDAMLAGAGRAVYAESPFDADTSLADVVDQTAADIRRCKSPDDDHPVAVAVLDPAQLEKLKSIDPEPLLDNVTPAEQKQFEEKQQEQLQKLEQEVQKMAQRPPHETQVVETAKPQVEVVPDNARYVSEYNTKVEKESVARGSRKEDMVQAPKPEELKVDPNTKQDPSTTKPPNDRPEGADERAPDAPGKLSMRTPGAIRPSEIAQEQRTAGTNNGETAPSSDGVQPRHGYGAVSQEHRDPSETPPGQAGAGGGAPHVPNLRPSDEMLQRVAGGGSVDHYDDVEEGDVTAVNSRQWVGAGFMNRTKRQVAQEWRPADVWRRYDPTGAVYGFKTRVTVLRVVLDGNGQLIKSTVIRGSGVDFLDDEAIRAFKAAAPFPNPPSVLRGDDGNITFNFGFYFEIDGGHESWKIFRAQ
jgi:TonB family protein